MTKDEALKMAIEFIDEITNAAGKYPYVDKTSLVADSYAMASKLKEALEQPEQEVKCNPHPKAPHGFSRDASHSADRYVCDCEGWDAWQDGYEEGLRKGLELEQPAQEPVAWKHFDKAYSKACNSSQPQDWMDAALLAQQARNTHPAPSWQGLSDNEIIGLNPYAFVDNDIKFARAIEQALKDKNS